MWRRVHVGEPGVVWRCENSAPPFMVKHKNKPSGKETARTNCTGDAKGECREYRRSRWYLAHVVIVSRGRGHSGSCKLVPERRLRQRSPRPLISRPRSPACRLRASACCRRGRQQPRRLRVPLPPVWESDRRVHALRVVVVQRDDCDLQSKAARGWEQAVAAARAGGSHLHRGCPAVARVERALPAREPRAARFASRRSTALVLATAPPPPRLLLLLPVALRLRLGTGAGAPPALLRLLRSPHHLVESVGRRQRLAARAAVGERLCGVEDRRPSAVRQQSGARADDEEMAPAKGAARVSRGERGWRCGKALREGGGDAGYSRLPAAAPGAREHHIQPARRGHKAEALRPAG